MKAALATAIQHFNLLATEHDRRKFLVDNSFLFARDKFGCQILQRKITEEVQLLNNTRTGSHSQFIQDVL